MLENRTHNIPIFDQEGGFHDCTYLLDLDRILRTIRNQVRIILFINT